MNILTYYNIAGTINAVFVLLSLAGILSQVQTIWRRKANGVGQSSTELLSLNSFSVGFFAYYAVFVYGFSIEPFNHYVVWSRLIACLLVLTILYAIWRDRETNLSLVIFIVALIALVLGISGLLLGHKMVDHGRNISTLLILVTTVLLAQGNIHQIGLIWRSGATGAIDIKMQFLIFTMHISTLVFVGAMGLATGWPFLFMALTGLFTKATMLYLFRWVRMSDIAQQRRFVYESIGKRDL